MKKILPFILSIVIPAIGFSQADSIYYGPGYANQVYYSFANGEVLSSNNTEWDIAFGTGGFDTDIRINDGFGSALYLYPNGDTADWNNVDTTGLQTWTPRYNSDTSWSSTAFNQYSSNDFDMGWGIYNPTSHNVVGDSMYILMLTDGSYKKFKIDTMSFFNSSISYTYANLDGSNEVTYMIDKSGYTSKKHVYFSLKSDSIMDLEPEQGSWDMVFTKYQSLQPQGGYYPVTGVLTAGEITSAEARNEPVEDAEWYGQDYVSNISNIGSNWKSFNMSTFSYDMVDSLSYFVTDTNNLVWQIYFTDFEGSSTGKTVFNKMQVGTTSIEKSNVAVNTVSVYPNPAVDNVTIAIESTESINNLNVTVFSLTGQIVHSEVVNVISNTNIEFPVSGWNQGMYLVRIGNDENAIVKQLVIQ